LTSALRESIEAQGFQEFGFASLYGSTLSLERYERWLALDLHGEMSYLQRHLSVKKDPASYFKKMKTAICFRVHYGQDPANEPEVMKGLRVALYARRPDYHDDLARKFHPLLETLRDRFRGEEFSFHTDSSPLLERDLAYRAGLGWFGKNSCLIDSKTGSLFFIAQILTSIDVDSFLGPHPDRCGTCNRCVEACPTEAILPDRYIDAKRCISYLTIESKSPPDERLRSKMADWFFGCDVCQTVCPWNEKVFGKERMASMSAPLRPTTEEVIRDLRWILEASDQELKKFFKDYPLERAKPFGLRRNALTVIGNLKIQELKPLVRELSKNPELESLARWTLEELGPE
jgi:epoxyqueuosine reductase